MSNQKFLGAVGLSGPIYAIDNSTGTLLLNETDNLPIPVFNNGFYHVSVEKINFIERTCTLVIRLYKSKKNFIIKYGSPIYSIIYFISDADQVLNELGDVISPGKFTQFLDISIVRLRNKSELDCSLELLLSLDGTSIIQETFPMSFSSMTLTSITQANIDNASA